MNVLMLLSAALALVVGVFSVVLWRQRKRNQMLATLLDDADLLESRLLETRGRMRTLEALLGRLPSDITENARASLASEAGIQNALKLVLSHRLWIRENAATASIAKLGEVAATAQRSLAQLEQQLARLEAVGAELQAAYAKSDALLGVPVGTETHNA